MGNSLRIRRSKASTPFFESGEPGGRLGDSRSSTEPGRGRQLGDRCSTGDKRRLMRPRAPAVYFEAVGVKRWATWRQVWEKRGRQVQNHVAQGTQSQKQVGDKRGTNAESCGPKHPQTSGIQVQNYAAQSIHSVLRDSGGQVGDKGNKSQTTLSVYGREV